MFSTCHVKVNRNGNMACSKREATRHVNWLHFESFHQQVYIVSVMISTD
jgi:hypothetical protein